MPFDAPYMFKANNTVVIQNKGNKDAEFKKFLRVKGGDEGTLDPNGGKGNLAQWAVELFANGTEIKLKSTKSGKYLRIFNNQIDVKGGGGKWTVFKVKMVGQNGGGTEVKLESKELPGKYIAVQKDNVIRIGNGGPWTNLRFFRNAPKAQPFTKPYLFGKVNTVVIQHKLNKFLRVKPNSEGELDQDGGKGAFAQWEATPMDGGKEVKLKSLKSGKYLRIGPQGNINVGGTGGKWTVFKVHKIAQGKVKLESKENGGKYIAVQKDNVIRVGNGGQWTEMNIFRKE